MIRLPRACPGGTAMRFRGNSSLVCCVELALEGLAVAGKGIKHTCFPRSLTDVYAMLMNPIKGETAACDCDCPPHMAVCVREILARPWVGVCVPLSLRLRYNQCNRIRDWSKSIGGWAGAERGWVMRV